MANQDYSHTAELMKASLPYLDSRTRPQVELFSKVLDLMGSLHSLTHRGSMVAYGYETASIDIEGMLGAIRPLCDNKEREFIDRILNIFHIKRAFEMYNNFMNMMNVMQESGGFSFHGEEAAKDDTDNVTSNFTGSGFDSIFHNFDHVSEMSEEDSKQQAEGYSLHNDYDAIFGSNFSNNHSNSNNNSSSNSNDGNGNYHNDGSNKDRNDGSSDYHNDSSNKDRNDGSSKDSSENYSNSGSNNYSNNGSNNYCNDDGSNYSNDDSSNYSNDFGNPYANDKSNSYTNDSSNYYHNNSSDPAEHKEDAQATSSGSKTGNSNHSFPLNSGMFDMFKGMVPPEQMSTFENLRMLFNTMSYDNNKKPDDGKEHENG